MNKYEKEYLKQNIRDEQAMLDALQTQYEEALKTINKKIKNLIESANEGNLSAKIYQIRYQKALKKQIEKALKKIKDYDTVYDYLEKCYEVGYIGTFYDIQKQGIPFVFPIDQESVVNAILNETKLSDGLYKRLGYNKKELVKVINAEIARGITNALSYAEIARNITKKTNLAMKKTYLIARTEGHRVMCSATYQAQKVAKDNGCEVLKQWDATLDNRTRDSHRMVDGEIRELDEPFSNGLMFPSDPNGSASEVCNCRCALLQRARWNLGQKELETLKERAKYFNLEEKKEENFVEYRKKYLEIEK